MKKYLYLVLVAAMCGVVLTSCNEKKNNPNGSKKGEWITSASEIDPSVLDDKDKKCWQIDLWCDGTTIGRTYEWATEAEVALFAKTMLTMDEAHFGYQTKKVKYELSSPTDEASCTSQTWAGAECWEETVSANGQSETNYGWMPEANMKERHDYYESKGVTHTYKRADANDQDACEALNGEDPVDPNPNDPKDYTKYDSTTYKCWKVTQTAYGTNIVNYVWLTERQLVEYYDQMGLTYNYEPTDAADEDACEELKDNNNPTDGEEACWQIVSNVMGQQSVQYYWGTESEAQMQVNAVNSTGVGTASYSKASATDPDSCDELNN